MRKRLPELSGALLSFNLFKERSGAHRAYNDEEMLEKGDLLTLGRKKPGLKSSP